MTRIGHPGGGVFIKLVILLSLTVTASLWWKLSRAQQHNTVLLAELSRLRSLLRAKRF